MEQSKSLIFRGLEFDGPELFSVSLTVVLVLAAAGASRKG